MSRNSQNSSDIIVLGERAYKLLPTNCSQLDGLHLRLRAQELEAEADWNDVRWFESHYNEIPEGQKNRPIVFAGAKSGKLVTFVQVMSFMTDRAYPWRLVDSESWRADVLLVKRIK